MSVYLPTGRLLISARKTEKPVANGGELQLTGKDIPNGHVPRSHRDVFLLRQGSAATAPDSSTNFVA